MNHMKILIFNVTFIFQTHFLENKYDLSYSLNTQTLLKTARGIKSPNKMFGNIVKLTPINSSTRCNQCVHLCTLKALLKPMFSGFFIRTLATKSWFRYTIWVLQRETFITKKNIFLKRVLVALPSVKEPLLNKRSFTCISPFQKGESVGLAVSFECCIIILATRLAFKS